MIGASADTDNLTIVIGLSAGGVLIGTLAVLWVRAWMKKKNDGGEK